MQIRFSHITVEVIRADPPRDKNCSEFRISIVTDAHGSERVGVKRLIYNDDFSSAFDLVWQDIGTSIQAIIERAKLEGK